MSSPRMFARPSRSSLFIVILVMLLVMGIMSERGMSIHSVLVHDDMLYMIQGISFSKFHWLGAYNELTLAKGLGLPAFLAAGHFSGLPFSYFQLGTLLVSLTIFSWSVARLCNRPFLFPVLAVMMLLLPTLYAESTARAVRETLFISLTFLMLAALTTAAIPGTSSRKSWLLGVAAGLSLSALWLTREEGITVLPMVAAFALIGFVRLRQTGWRRAGDWALVKAVSAALITLAVILGCVASINALVYDRFIVNELKGGNFPRAMTILQRASHKHWQPLLPVPRAARLEIYRESPTFARLQPYLDPIGGQSPWQFGCDFAGTIPAYSATCGDIAGGWWMWALRTGAARAGAYESARTADEFFGMLVAEVSDACASGRLSCAGWRPPLIPPMSLDQWYQLPSRTIGMLSAFAVGLPVHVDPQPSALTPEWRRQLLELLNFPRVAENAAPRRISLRGWYWRPGGGFIRAESVEGGAIVSMQRHDSPDVANAIDPEARNQRFSLQYECPSLPSGCPIRITPDNSAGSAVIDLATLQPGANPLGDGHLQIDSVAPEDGSLISIRSYAYEGFVAILGALAPVYRLLCIIGPIAFVAALVRRRQSWSTDPLLLLATALALGVGARAIVLALIDLTSWPVLSAGYLYPASGPPMLVAFAFLSIIAAVSPPTYKAELEADQ